MIPLIVLEVIPYPIYEIDIAFVIEEYRVGILIGIEISSSPLANDVLVVLAVDI